MPPPAFDHLGRLTGEFGLFEHAELDVPREDHGYTTDDNARALVVLTRVPVDRRPRWFERAVHYVASGRVPFGWRNRMSRYGHWSEVRGSDDAHGRALWGLGALLGSGADDDEASTAFLAGLDLRTSHPRANAYAALGAVAAADCGALRPDAERFLDRLHPALVRTLPRSGRWMWPETRLTYDNARIPQALILAGSLLQDMRLVDGGLDLLAWLLDIESGPNGFSFTPTTGRGPGQETVVGFDQQPIEAWAMADACAAASSVDGSAAWRKGVRQAAEWFLGRNDAGVVLYDHSTGAGFDGLERHGANQNRGAESTLSALGALLTAGAAG